MQYWRLKYDFKSPDERTRVIGNLQTLRGQIESGMPERTATERLILGTWNIRNFDDNRFGHGPRRREALYYIAETISAFDVMAVQELTDDLGPLDEVMKLLDPTYKYLVTDLTEGPSGNRERLGFLYDSGKVQFTGVAGEIVLPYRLLISDVTKQLQFARTPFCCSFQSRWFKFMFATVHIYYGSPSKSSPEYKRRVQEIDSVAGFLAERAKNEDYNYILVGDFNIEDFEGDSFDALARHGFQVFRNKTGSNSKKNKFYDQISFRSRPEELRLAGSDKANGVLDLFTNLYTAGQFSEFEPQVRETVNTRLQGLEADLAKAVAKGTTAKAKKIEKDIADLNAMLADPAQLEEYYLEEWRTYQLSDHFPLWVELEIDFASAYLDRLKG